MAEKDEHKAKLHNLQHCLRQIGEACGRQNIKELELRQSLSCLVRAMKDMDPYWKLLKEEAVRQFNDETNTYQTKALKLIRTINPRVLSLEDAVGTAVPCQEISNTRSNSAKAAPSGSTSGTAGSQMSLGKKPPAQKTTLTEGETAAETNINGETETIASTDNQEESGTTQSPPANNAPKRSRPRESGNEGNTDSAMEQAINQANPRLLCLKDQELKRMQPLLRKRRKKTLGLDLGAAQCQT